MYAFYLVEHVARIITTLKNGTITKINFRDGTNYIKFREARLTVDLIMDINYGHHPRYFI